MRPGKKNTAPKDAFYAIMPVKPSKLPINSSHKRFRRILTVYAKGKKGITEDKKATTQNEKDILGTKRTKQGHSGQQDRKGTF